MQHSPSEQRTGLGQCMLRECSSVSIYILRNCVKFDRSMRKLNRTWHWWVQLPLKISYRTEFLRLLLILPRFNHLLSSEISLQTWSIFSLSLTHTRLTSRSGCWLVTNRRLLSTLATLANSWRKTWEYLLSMKTLQREWRDSSKNTEKLWTGIIIVYKPNLSVSMHSWLP